MRNWLRELRTKNQKTMKCIASELGISESYYCAIENGDRKKKMDVMLIDGLSNALNVSVSHIMKCEMEYCNEDAKE